MLSIIGGNLAGKTTLANIIIRKHLEQLEGILSGTIEFVFDPSRSDVIGLLFEDVHWMFCNLHVEEEVAFGLENLGVAPPDIRRRVTATLEQTGLAGFERRQLSTLSGGEMQKLAIAAVLATEPQILITDDLLSNLDVVSSRVLPELLGQYRRHSGCLWIDLSRRWATHSSAGDRVALLKAGTLLDHGPPAKIFEQLGDRLVADGDVELPELLEMLSAANQALALRNLPKLPVTFERAQLFDAMTRRYRPRPPSNSQSRAPIGNEKSSLDIDNVSFQYGRGSPVLTNCSLAVIANRINILAGRNGSGKSTLVKICAGLLKPNRGRVLWQNSPASQRLLREKVCLVFQNPEYHFLADTAFEELYLTGRLLSLPDTENTKQVEWILARLGLESRAGISPFALTSGEKRRLAIGIALVRKAEILIVDEPTLGQDKSQSRMLGLLFKQLASEDTTLILVSHDRRFIFEHGDVLHLLQGGRVTCSGAIPGFFASSSQSDFSGQSDVMAFWERMGNGNHAVEYAPRSTQELFQSLEPVPDGYSRYASQV